MEIFVILGVVALASWLAYKQRAPDATRIDKMEALLNDVAEQVADCLLDED